jgi:hypothetical protein
VLLPPTLAVLAAAERCPDCCCHVSLQPLTQVSPGCWASSARLVCADESGSLLLPQAQQRMQQPPSPGALSLASTAPGSPGAALGLQGGTPPLPRGQQQQPWHQQQQIAAHAGQPQLDEPQVLHGLQQQGHGQPPPRPALPPQRTVSFDGGAGASHIAGARSSARQGFVHGRAGFNHLDTQTQQQAQQQQAQQQQQRQPGFGCADLGRSSSFASFVPPAPYQPAGADHKRKAAAVAWAKHTSFLLDFAWPTCIPHLHAGHRLHADLHTNQHRCVVPLAFKVETFRVEAFNLMLFSNVYRTMQACAGMCR